MPDMPPTYTRKRDQVAASREYDKRRDQRLEHRAWYDTAAWKERRKRQLQLEPLCARCQAEGRTVPATVANHVGGHRGDRWQFFYGSLESTCKPCHDGQIQREERAARAHR